MTKVSGESFQIDGLSATMTLNELRLKIAKYLGVAGGRIQLMCETPFTIEDRQKTLSELGIGAQTSLSLMLIANGMGFAGRYYVLTEDAWRNEEDTYAIVTKQFGPDAKMADFDHFVANPGTKEDCIAFLTFLGCNAWVQYEGKRFWSGDRHYFIERHDGKVPSGWLVHNSIHDHLLDLGSWFSKNRILVDLGEE